MIKKLLLISMMSITLLLSNKTVYAADTAYKNEVDVITDTESNNYYKLKTLIVTSSKPLNETYNAIAAENCANVIQILQYETELDTKNAYYKLKQNGYEVAVDQIIDIEHNNYDTGSYIDTLNVVNNLHLDKAQEMTSGKSDFHIAVFDYPYNKIDYPNDRVITKSDSTKYTAFERDENGNIVYDDSGYPCYKEFDIDFSKGSNSHGTYVTSVLLDSTSSNVKIHSYTAGVDHYYKTDDGEKNEQLNNSVAEIISELDRIVEDKCKVVNMSIQWTINTTTLQKPIKIILDKLNNNGIIIVAAAGNDSEEISTNTYPQCLDYIINVSSVSNNKSLSSFSNTGNIDFCAPGEAIPTMCNNYVSGTSFSSPYITSFIAEILQINNYINPVDEIENSLSLYCDDLGTIGKDNLFGNGFPVFTAELNLCKNGHTYESTIIEPTCTSTGYTQNVCVNCGISNTTDSTYKLNHNYKLKSKVDPTCTKYGYSTYVCTECGDEITKDIIDALQHVQANEIVKATCKTAGYNKVYCSRCNQTLYSMTLPVNSANHTYEESTIDATCQHGKQIWNTCTECNHKVLVNTIGNPIDHLYKNDICEFCELKKPITSTESQSTESTTTENKDSNTTTTTTEKPTNNNKKESVTKKTRYYIKVVKLSKKKIKLSWKKISKAKYYQIQISTSKKFAKKYTKTYTTKKCTYTIKNLKKKTYYIRVRAKYKNKKYSSWKTITKYQLK